MPIEVDEVTTWARIQPGTADVMRAAGAVPLVYADMAAAYPDLFSSADAARMTITREAKNPEQTPVEEGDPFGENPEQTPISYLLGVCSGFLRQGYRRRGARGPAGTLLYDPMRIEPRSWLTEHLGEVVLFEAPDDAAKARPPEQPATCVFNNALQEVPARAPGLRPTRVEAGAGSPASDRALAAWGEIDEERAAIIEFDGDIPRIWAEAFSRLHPDRPPARVPLRRWQQFIDDIGRFLDSGFAKKAAAFGWGPFDLFGCALRFPQSGEPAGERRKLATTSQA